MAKRPMTDVVVLLPGILGSVLEKDGKVVWAPTAGAVVDALFSLGRNVADLELRDEKSDDGVSATRLMPDLHLVPGLWKIDGYSKVAQFIQDNFDVTPGQNFFQFPYDWRHDNRLAASTLKNESERWLGDWRRNHPDAKLVLIGHSMGGLVSRYFLECLDGWRDTRSLLTFGTPYRGSLKALNFLVNGMKKSLGPITFLDLSQLLRSFTSVYQLLPIYKCLDDGNGEMIRVSEAAGIPNLDQHRAALALAFHREIETAVTQHLNNDEYRHYRYSVHPIIGTFQPTLLSAVRSGDSVKFLETHPDQDADGDGTVPRVSATPIELPHEEGAMFAAEQHGSLQNNNAVLVQLAGILSGRDTSRVRAGSRLGLELDDAYGPGEPFTFRVRSEDPLVDLTAVITTANPGEEVARIKLDARKGWRATEAAPFPHGAYRVTVVGDGAEPVSDSFIVVPSMERANGGGGEARKRRERGEPIIEPGLGGVIDSVVSGLPDSAPITRPALEQRYLRGRFPERIQLRETVSLTAWIAIEKHDRLTAALKPIAIPPTGAEVVLNLVDHPGFTARSPERQAVKVFPGVNSAPVAFDLQATQEGVHALQLEAFLGGTHLGGLQIQTTVQEGITTGPTTVLSARVGGREADPGEVSLLIHFEEGTASYRYQLIDWSGDVPDESTSNPLLKTPTQAVEELVKQLNAVARGGSPWDAQTTTTWLKNQGIALWDGFIPQALKNEFWARRDRITKMSIISSGDPVPWELLYPSDGPGKDAGFLVDQFPVARRRFGAPPTNQLLIRSADIVLSGAQSLTSAPAEVTAVGELLAANNITMNPVSDLTGLLSSFEAASFGLLHFACHNSFATSMPNASRLMIGDQPFEPVFLAQHVGRFAQSRPLVFMNACRTDGQSALYTTVEGWAASFLKAGAGVFIGSLWEVVDSSASTYAQEFYRAVLSGLTLGAAAKKARDSIRDEPGDPTWLAYAMYGDPDATLGQS